MGKMLSKVFIEFLVKRRVESSRAEPVTHSGKATFDKGYEKNINSLKKL